MTQKLQQFIANLKSSFLNTTEFGKICAVLGNESCDLDSTISSLVYAFFLATTKMKDSSVTVVPILNMNKEDYSLKTEIKYWLHQHNILQQDLFFRNDIDLSMLHEKGLLQLVLVDHNVLAKGDSDLESSVTFVLDHHKKERLQEPEEGMVIAPVGSCCTLVTHELIEKCPSLLKEPSIASLLTGTIILDTANFSDLAKRFNNQDVSVFEHLVPLLPSSFNQEDVFNKLVEAKSDVSSLTIDECLRKDRKIVHSKESIISISSLPISSKEFLNRGNFLEEIQNHLSSNKFSCIIIMGVSIMGSDIKRDLVIYSNNDMIRNKIKEFLCNVDNGILNLSEAPIDAINTCLFNQENVTASRKVVMPLIKQWANQK